MVKKRSRVIYKITSCILLPTFLWSSVVFADPDLSTLSAQSRVYPLQDDSIRRLHFALNELFYGIQAILSGQSLENVEQDLTARFEEINQAGSRAQGSIGRSVSFIDCRKLGENGPVSIKFALKNGASEIYEFAYWQNGLQGAAARTIPALQAGSLGRHEGDYFEIRRRQDLDERYREFVREAAGRYAAASVIMAAVAARAVARNQRSGRATRNSPSGVLQDLLQAGYTVEIKTEGLVVNGIEIPGTTSSGSVTCVTVSNGIEMLEYHYYEKHAIDRETYEERLESLKSDIEKLLAAVSGAELASPSGRTMSHALIVPLENIVTGQGVPAKHLTLVKSIMLADASEAEAWGVSLDTIDQVIEQRLEILKDIWPDFSAWWKETLKTETVPIDTLWHVYIPFAQRIVEEKRATRPDGVYVVGVYGSQGRGKTTLSQALTRVLNYLLDAEADGQAVARSLDDYYLPRAEREAMRPLGYDPGEGISNRGPPGTHDTELLLRTIRLCDESSRDSVIPMTIFDKGVDDLSAKPLIVHERVGVFVLEGWFVGCNTNITQYPSDPFKRRVAEALVRDYKPVFDRIDALWAFDTPPIEEIKRQRIQQEETRRLAEPDKPGMTDAQLGSFVDYFYQDPWDWEQTSPVPKFQDVTFCSIIDAERRVASIRRGERASPSGTPSPAREEPESREYREKLLKSEPIDREIHEVLVDFYCRTMTLLARRKKETDPAERERLVAQMRSDLKDARRRVGDFSRITPRRRVIEAMILETRRMAYEHLKNAERMIGDIGTPNEPAALWALSAAQDDIQRARGQAVEYRTSLQDKVARVTFDSERGIISLTQQTYVLLGKKTRIPIGNYAPRKYKTLWQAFRSLDDQRRTELDDHLFLRRGVKTLEDAARRIRRNEAVDLESDLRHITRMLNPRRGDIKVEEKRLSRIYIREAIELYQAGDRDGAEVLLKKAAEQFKRRIANIESILGNLEAGHVETLRALAREWNDEIGNKANRAIVALGRGWHGDVEGIIKELLEHRAIDEPQYHGLKLLLGKTLAAFKKDQARYARYIRYNLELIRRKAWGGNLLAGFMVDFRTAWVKARLKQGLNVDPSFIEQSVFTSCFKAFAKRRNIARGSPQEEIWWTRCYQPSFISTRSTDPKRAKEKGITSQLFKAVSDVIVLQEVINLSRVLEEYSQRLPRTHDAITGLIEEARQAQPQSQTRLVAYRELTSDQKARLLKAVADDHELDASQRHILYSRAVVPYSVQETARGRTAPVGQVPQEEIKPFIPKDLAQLLDITYEHQRIPPQLREPKGIESLVLSCLNEGTKRLAQQLLVAIEGVDKGYVQRIRDEVTSRAPQASPSGTVQPSPQLKVVHSGLRVEPITTQLTDKKIVIFGAGVVGRGFIAELFRRAGYEITLVDIDEGLIKRVNEQGSYPLYLIGKENHKIIIPNARALHTTNDLDAVIEAVQDADILALAVPEGPLRSVCGTIARCLQERIGSGRTTPIDIILARNADDPTKDVRDFILDQTEDPGIRAEIDRTTGIVGTVVSRMMPIVSEDVTAVDPSAVFGEAYSRLPVDRSKFKGELPVVEGLEFPDRFDALVERKLFVHNCGHAICAYLGYLKGHQYVYEAIRDPEILPIVEGAMQEAGQALTREYAGVDGFSDDQMSALIADLIERFDNEPLADTVFRVGRDPIRKLGRKDRRLIGPAILAMERDIPIENLAKGIAAAIQFYHPEDPRSVDLRHMWSNEGLGAIFEEVCGIEITGLLAQKVVGGLEWIRQHFVTAVATDDGEEFESPSGTWSGVPERHFTEGTTYPNKIIFILGPSGSGKSTLVERLIRDHPEQFIKLEQTRTRAAGEQEAGRDPRMFITREAFESKLGAGKMHFAREMHGNWYGLDEELFVEALESGKVIITGGHGIVEDMRKYFPNSEVIVISSLDLETTEAPELERILRERIARRGRPIPESEIRERVQEAVEYKEILARGGYRQIVNPDDAEDGYREFEHTVLGFAAADQASPSGRKIEEVRERIAGFPELQQVVDDIGITFNAGPDLESSGAPFSRLSGRGQSDIVFVFQDDAAFAIFSADIKLNTAEDPQTLFETAVHEILYQDTIRELIIQLTLSRDQIGFLEQSGYAEWRACVRELQDAEKYGYDINGYNWGNSAAGVLKFFALATINPVVERSIKAILGDSPLGQEFSRYMARFTTWQGSDQNRLRNALTHIVTGGAPSPGQKRAIVRLAEEIIGEPENEGAGAEGHQASPSGSVKTTRRQEKRQELARIARESETPLSISALLARLKEEPKYSNVGRQSVYIDVREDPTLRDLVRSGKIRYSPRDGTITSGQAQVKPLILSIARRTIETQQGVIEGMLEAETVPALVGNIDRLNEIFFDIIDRIFYLRDLPFSGDEFDELRNYELERTIEALRTALEAIRALEEGFAHWLKGLEPVTTEIGTLRGRYQALSEESVIIADNDPERAGKIAQYLDAMAEIEALEAALYDEMEAIDGDPHFSVLVARRYIALLDESNYISEKYEHDPRIDSGNLSEVKDLLLARCSDIVQRELDCLMDNDAQWLDRYVIPGDQEAHAVATFLKENPERFTAAEIAARLGWEEGSVTESLKRLEGLVRTGREMRGVVYHASPTLRRGIAEEDFVQCINRPQELYFRYRRGQASPSGILEGFKDSPDVVVIDPSLTTMEGLVREGRIEEFIQRAKWAEEAGAGSLHLDIFDPVYVPTKDGKGNMDVFTPELVGILKKEIGMPVHVHLMVRPEAPRGGMKRYVEAFADAGADFITLHWSAFADKSLLIETLEAIREADCYAGIAFNPGEDVRALEELERYGDCCDYVIVMSVMPGAGGRGFEESALDSLETLQEMDTDKLIGVDGAITDETVGEVAKHGGQWLCSGSYYFGKYSELKTREEVLEAQKTLVETARAATGPAVSPNFRKSPAGVESDGPRAIEPLIEALEDGDVTVRRRAAKALGEIRDPRAVNYLIPLLGDPDWLVRQTAAIALEQIGDHRAADALIEALDDTDRVVRKVAARVLGQIGDPRAVDALIKALRDEGKDVRQAAALALGQIGELRAVDALIEALNDRDKDVHETAAWALGKIADSRAVGPLIEALDHAYEHGNPPADALSKIGSPAVEPLIHALKSSQWRIRHGAAYALGKIGDPRAVEPLISVLGDSEGFVRFITAHALGKIGDPSAIEPLISTLNDSDQSVCRAAAQALDQLRWQPSNLEKEIAYLFARQDWDGLVEIGSPAVNILIATLENDSFIIGSDWKFRDIAALALVRIGSPAVEPLILALTNPLWRIRHGAAYALGEIGDPRAVESLISVLGDSDWHVRGEAAGALGSIRDPIAVEYLTPLLVDSDWLVRKGVVKALGNIGGSRVVEPLTGALRDKDKDVRKAAAEALDQLHWRPSNLEQEIAYLFARQGWDGLVEIGSPAVDVLIEALNDRDKDVRRAAAQALGEVGDRKAAAPLIEVLRGDESSYVREAAAKALGQIDDPRAIDALTEALEDRDRDVRLAAAEVLGRTTKPRVIEPRERAFPARKVPYAPEKIITSADDFAKVTSQKVADEIRELQRDPEKQVVIVFATGNTMVGFLNNLALEEGIDWKRIQAFHLDEYKGLPPEDEHSFAYFLNENLFRRVPIPEENIHYINGARPDPDAYMRKLKEYGGADIVLLGVGMDGHLAFCEPPLYSSFNSGMQEVELDERTIESNEPDYPGIRDNPYAYTMGMRDIYEGRHIYFFVNKSKKAGIVQRSLEGPITEGIPASMLQVHRNVTVVLDVDAASFLFEGEAGYLLAYKREVPENIDSVSLYERKRIVVLEKEEGDADVFVSNAIRALEENGNSMLRINATSPNALEELGEFGPDIIMSPDRDAEASILVQRYANSIGGVNALFYETLVVPPEVNLSVGFGQDAMARTVQAINEGHVTQVRRTDYATVAKEASAYAASYAGYKGFGAHNEPYANSFVVCRIDRNGRLIPPDTSGKYQVVFGDQEPQEGFEAIRVLGGPDLYFISPHPDDPEIAASGLIREVLEQGGTAHNFIFGTGQCGVILTDEEKAAGIDVRTIRRPEARKAADILQSGTEGKVVIYNLDLEVSSQSPALGEVTADNPAFQGTLEIVKQNFAAPFEQHSGDMPLVFVVPHPRDGHPHHRTATNLAIQALCALAREYNIEVQVLYYLAPWAGGYNIYFHSTENYIDRSRSPEIVMRSEIASHYKQCLSRITAELTGGFGSKSPTCDEMGGEFAERFRRIHISPSSTCASPSGKDQKVDEAKLVPVAKTLTDLETAVGKMEEAQSNQRIAVWRKGVAAYDEKALSAVRGLRAAQVNVANLRFPLSTNDPFDKLVAGASGKSVEVLLKRYFREMRQAIAMARSMLPAHLRTQATPVVVEEADQAGAPSQDESATPATPAAEEADPEPAESVEVALYEVGSYLTIIGPEKVSCEMPGVSWKDLSCDDAIGELESRERGDYSQVDIATIVSIDYVDGQWAHIKLPGGSAEEGFASPSGTTELEDQFIQDVDGWFSPGMLDDDIVIGVPKEMKLYEKRVGLTPDGVRLLREKGVKRILVERGAGRDEFSDEEYEIAGATLVDRETAWSANLIVKVKEPLSDEYRFLRPDQVVFTYFHLASQENKGLTRALQSRDIGAAVAYETVEVDGRTPLLEPMSEVAGTLAAYFSGFYMSHIGRYMDRWAPQRLIDQVSSMILPGVLPYLPGIYPGPPAPGVWSLQDKSAVVLGGGTVGVHAGLMLARLGANVTITEIRPERIREIEEIFEQAGLRDKLTVLNPRQEDLVEAALTDSDIIISDVYQKGKKAPRLISKNLLKKISELKKKFIVDVAIDQGGNVWGSRTTYYDDPVFVDKFGNARFCVANMPAAVPKQASQMLEAAKLKYVLALACGLRKGVEVYPELKGGINVIKGKLVSDDVINSHRFKAHPLYIIASIVLTATLAYINLFVTADRNLVPIVLIPLGFTAGLILYKYFPGLFVRYHKITDEDLDIEMHEPAMPAAGHEDTPVEPGSADQHSPAGARMSERERQEEVARVVDYMRRMLPNGNELSAEDIMSHLVTSNLDDSRRISYTRESWLYRILPLPIFKRRNKLPPTFVFRGDIFPDYEGKAKPRFIAVTSSADGVAITSIFSETANIDLILAKGGCRWYEVGKSKITSMDEKFLGNPEKSLDPLLPEGVRLGEAMYYKSPFWESYFDGGKTIFLARKGVRKQKFVRDWVASSILGGCLMKLYIAGPDVQMSYREMEWIEDEKVHAYKEFHKPATDLLATTSRDPKKYGTFPHEDWMVTSIGVVGTLVTALSNEELMRRFGIDPDNLTLAIVGFGDVGGGVIRDLAVFHPELFARIKITLVATIEGAIYNPDGLDKAQLLHLLDLRDRLGKDFKLQDFYHGDYRLIEDTREAYYTGATILIPAARGTFVRTEEDIRRMAAAGTKLISEGANNFVAQGIEHLFEPNGILYYYGPVANGGGIYSSKEEILHALIEGTQSMMTNMPSRRYHIQGDIADTAIGNATWLADMLLDGRLGNTVYEIHQRIVDEIITERSRLLDDPSPDEAHEIRQRVEKDFMRGVRRNEENLRVLTIVNATELARERVMGHYIDRSALLANLSSENLNVRRGAAYWAGKLRIHEAYDQLVAVVQSDPDQGEDRQPKIALKRLAAISLGYINDRRAIHELLDANSRLTVGEGEVLVGIDWALEYLQPELAAWVKGNYPQMNSPSGVPQTTPIYEWHKEHAQQIADFHGWLMPIHYGSALDEHVAVRQAAGIFDIGHMGVLEVRGEAALEFLQKVTTNDVAQLKEGGVQYSYIVDENGRIIDDIMVTRFKDRYMMVVNASNTEAVKEWLALKRDEVAGAGDIIIDDMRQSQIDPATNKVMLAIQGPRSLAILQRLSVEDLSDMRYFTAREVELDGIRVVVSRTGYTGERGYEIFVHPDRALELWEKLLEAGRDDGLKPCGLAARDSLRLEAGLPLCGHELGGDLNITPFEAGFGDFVSFDKGDFVGREALLEQQRRAGRNVVNLLLVNSVGDELDLELRGMPMPTHAMDASHPASTVFAKTREGAWVEVGAITSRTIETPTWRKEGFADTVKLAMGCVRSDVAKPGAELMIETRGKYCYAVVLPRNFYDNAGDRFAREYMDNYIPVTDEERAEMLEVIGVQSADELFGVIPQEDRSEQPLELPPQLNRMELFLHMWRLSRRNQTVSNVPSFLGAGMRYGEIPAIVDEAVSERTLSTSYTAYQPEIDQGFLEAIYLFQSLIRNLTGMEVANASMYEGGSALAEAALMSYRIGARDNRMKIVVAGSVNPFQRAVLETYARNYGPRSVQLEIVEVPFDRSGQIDMEALKKEVDATTACVIAQQPNFFGCLEPRLGEIADVTHQNGALFIVSADMGSLATLRPPAEYGADIVVGEGQVLGNRLNFGGPGLGVIATKKEFVREMPGRIVGKTLDADGRPGYAFALRTRGQDIRRERAKSNICSDEALCAFSATFYLMEMANGRRLEESSWRSRILAAEMARQIESIPGFNVPFARNIFTEFVVESALPIGLLNEELLKRGIIGGLDISNTVGRRGNYMLISVSDMTTADDAEKLAHALVDISQHHKGRVLRWRVASAMTRTAEFLKTPFKKDASSALPAAIERPRGDTAQLIPGIGTETLRRYVAYLAKRNFGIDDGPYFLGSCTMKYNPLINEIVAAFEGFSNLHPYQSEDTVQGTLEIMYQTERMLSEVCGFSQFTLQPAAGAHGELTGMKIMKSYHETSGHPERDLIIAPDSSHGTNPASAAMAGFRVKEIVSNSDGTINLDALRAVIAANQGRIAGIMITNPNTLGLFEINIREVCEIVHAAGGLVYMDGANLNAIIGRARPAEWGIDILHVNLHKTFGTPHGGGGPGSGPVGVREDLVRFLPKPAVAFDQTNQRYYLDNDRPDSIGKMHTNFGNIGVIIKAYAYLRALGADGLRSVSENAVVNANYVMARLKGHYSLPYAEGQHRMHEFVIAPTREMVEKTGSSVKDITTAIGKALLDRGIHAPTSHFPLIVDGALMIEPTETVSKAWLDQFCDAMIDIAGALLSDDPEVRATVLEAPLKTPVRRLDVERASREDTWDFSTDDILSIDGIRAVMAQGDEVRVQRAGPSRPEQGQTSGHGASLDEAAEGSPLDTGGDAQAGFDYSHPVDDWQTDLGAEDRYAVEIEQVDDKPLAPEGYSVTEPKGEGKLGEEWYREAEIDGRPCYVMGITAYSQFHMGEIIFVELPHVGDDVTEGERYGDVEAVKAIEAMNAPVSGRVLMVNEYIREKPITINEDPYGAGWTIIVEKPAQGEELQQSPSGAISPEEKVRAWRAFIEDTALLLGIGMVAPDFDGVIRKRGQGEDGQPNRVEERFIRVIRSLIDQGVLHVTVTGEVFGEVEKRLGPRFDWNKLGLREEDRRLFWLIMSTGAIGRTVLRDYEFERIDGFVDSDLNGTEREIARILQELAVAEGVPIGTEDGKSDAQISLEGVTLELERLSETEIARVKDAIASKARAMIPGIDGIPDTTEIVASASAVDVIPTSKGRALAQAIRIATEDMGPDEVFRVLIVVDSVGTEESPGNDRSMLELTEEMIKAWEPAIRCRIELIKVYVGSEPDVQVSDGVLIAPQPGTDSTFEAYDAIDRAKKEPSVESPAGIVASVGTVETHDRYERPRDVTVVEAARDIAASSVELFVPQSLFPNNGFAQTREGFLAALGGQLRVYTDFDHLSRMIRDPKRSCVLLVGQGEVPEGLRAMIKDNPDLTRVRFVNAQAVDLAQTDPEERNAYYRRIFAVMSLVRVIESDDISRESNVYTLLTYYLGALLPEGISVDDYLNTLVSAPQEPEQFLSHIARVITAILSYRPSLPYDMEEIEATTQVLWAA